MQLRTVLGTTVLALIAGVGHCAATDPDTGLIVAEGWELAAAHCGGCHSYRLVTAQRGDEAFWRSTIRWMQSTQNLWQIPAAQESTGTTWSK